ncbi:MAG TPA: glycosyltransferase family 4 protein [Myxococcota bacterium]|nr:glycosyltransferase family 4 protein [Myxococcota bacterium]
MQQHKEGNDEPVERSDRQTLLIASRVFGASGQPWLWRQVVGLREFRKELLCWERHNPANYLAQDVEVHVLPGDPAPYDGAGRWWYRLRNLAGRNFYAAVGREKEELLKLLDRLHPDAILCYFGDTAMRLLPVALRKGIPVVAYFHGDFQFLDNRWYRWSLLRSLSHFSAIIVVTDAERDWMVEHGVAKERIHWIPCGASTNLFRPRNSTVGGPARFVMVSRLSLEKGCELSVRAFGMAAKDLSDSELHIYGDGPMRKPLEELVAELDVKDRVTFHGYVDERRLADVLPGYDVFIQHTVGREGSPVSVVEAMACGLPVVVTPAGDIVRQVVAEETGLLVAKGDIPAMALAMRRLACDADLRQTLGRAARERAVNLYDSSAQTRRLERVLLETAGGIQVRGDDSALCEGALGG